MRLVVRLVLPLLTLFLSCLPTLLCTDFYKQAFRSGATPTALLDRDLMVIDMTDSYIDVLHTSREKCVASSFREMIRARLNVEYAKEMIDTIETVTLERTSRSIEVRDLRRDHFWKVHIHPWEAIPKHHYLRPWERETPFVAVQVTDLTDMVLSNSRMHSTAVSADIYHKIVLNIHDYAIFMLDTTGHVMTWNAGAQRLLLYTEEEIVGQHFGIFFREEDRLEGEPDQELEKAFAGADGFQTEGLRVRRDGSLFVSSISMRPMYDEQQKHIGFVKVTRDMTHRKRAEAAMLAAYEHAAEMKHGFLATASHELRSPLTVIISAIENLLALPHCDEQKEIMMDIKRAGVHLKKMVDNLLNYNQMAANAYRLSFSDIDLRRVVKSLAQEYGKRSQVPIHYHVSPDVPTVLVGDMSRLQQVMSNILSNAIKFTNQGWIKISVHLRRKSGSTLTESPPTTPPKVSLLVRIEDTGIGLSPEQMDRLFIPFSQADDTIAGRYGGTGLGLSICKQCVELMNGRIWVESEEGKGSAFLFTLDMEIGDGAKAAAKRHTSSASTERKILPVIPCKVVVVDDNEMIRRVMMRSLMTEGISPLSFTDGAEVVAYFEQVARQYEQDLVPKDDYIILMDVEMPNLNGLDATRKLLSMLPIAEHIAVIGVTANAMHGDRYACGEAGMIGYLSKPFKADQLASQINAASRQLASRRRSKQRFSSDSSDITSSISH